MSDQTEPKNYIVFKNDDLICVTGEDPKLLICCQDGEAPTRTFDSTRKRSIFVCCPPGYVGYISKPGLTGCLEPIENNEKR